MLNFTEVRETNAFKRGRLENGDLVHWYQSTPHVVRLANGMRTYAPRTCGAQRATYNVVPPNCAHCV